MCHTTFIHTCGHTPAQYPHKIHFSPIDLRAPIHHADGVLATARLAAPAAFAPVMYHQVPLARGERTQQAEIALEGTHVGVDFGKGLHAHRHRVNPRLGEYIGKRRLRRADEVPPAQRLHGKDGPAPCLWALAMAPSIS